MTNRSRGIVWLVATGVCLAGIYAAFRQPIEEPEPMADGSMPHADHSPRHGGMFFMAPDRFHHVEGTLSLETQEFRLYVYDNYTRPMDARHVQARVGPRRLVSAEDGAYLTVQLLDVTGDPPQVTAFVRFARDAPEHRFDFVFVPELAQSP